MNPKDSSKPFGSKAPSINIYLKLREKKYRMFNKIDYVMVMVSDRGKSLSFYKDIMELKLHFSSEF